jgi:hypothetical protein
MKNAFSSGYIAITTAVMISVVMVLLAISLSSLSLYGRTNGLAASLKSKTQFAAQGCLEDALLKLSLNNGYSGNESATIQLDGESVSCTIAPLSSEGTNKVIKVQSTINSLTTNLKLKVDAATLSRVSLEETSTL